MKRMMIALVAGLVLSTGVASADPGGFAPPGGPNAAAFASFQQMGGPNTLIGAGDVPPWRGPDMYGLHPCLKRFFHIPPGGRCANGCGVNGYGHGGYGHGGYGANMGAAGYGAGGPYYGPNGQIMQGTLAFPHHTFVRSPRDFFMVDVNK